MTWLSSPSDHPNWTPIHPRIQCVGQCVGAPPADAHTDAHTSASASASTSASATTPKTPDSRSIQCVGSASAVRRNHTTRASASSVRRLGSPLLGSRRTRRAPHTTHTNTTPNHPHDSPLTPLHQHSPLMDGATR